jgi:beta-glucosidase
VGLVDEAVLRILYAKVHFGVIDKWDKTKNWSPWLTKSDATQALALEAAREGIVLLKNGATAALTDDVLPLSAATQKVVAVVGKFANSENMGDKGSSDAKVVDSSLVITPYEGIAERLGATNPSVSACAGATPCALAFESVAGHEAALATADVIVVVGAYYPADLARSSTGEEGEWKDRVSMSLPQRDLDNINAAIALRGQNPNLKIVVVMKSGGAIVVNPWIADVDAVVMAWFAGMKEGTALGEILFGDISPSGKVVQSFPAEETDLPPFQNATTGDVSYDYYHGYRWLDRQSKAARWPFGFGLSYTTFAYSNLVVASPTIPESGTLSVTVDITNTGTRIGSEVVQLYVGYPNTALADSWGRPKKELKAFARVADLAPGAKATVILTVKASDLGYWNTATKQAVVEHAAHALWVGPSSDTNDPNTQKGTFTVQ